MPSKTTKYPLVHFPPEVIEGAFDVYTDAASKEYVTRRIASGFVGSEPVTTVPANLTRYEAMSVHSKRDQWTFDTIHEFFEELRKGHELSFVDFGTLDSVKHTLSLWMSVQIKEFGWGTEVVITHPTKSEVSRISSFFETAAPKFKAPAPAPAPMLKPRIFVGHGGKSGQWRNLKDHLADVHGYEVVAFESGARAGNAIRDILSGMLDASTFAILVMTGEDAQNDGTMRARQNVVHEAGLFQGHLGFSRAIILLENGTENFSNLDGIQYIPFSEGNIREAFGDVLGTLRREFPAA